MLSSEQTIKERVFSAADQLHGEGVTVSVRKVMAHIGGGNTSKITAALRDWKEQHAKSLTTLSIDDCPDEVKSVFIRNASKLIDETTEQLQKDIDFYKQVQNDNIMQLDELEASLKSTSDLLDREKKGREDDKNKLEKELTAMQERNKALQNKVTELEQSLETSRKNEQLALTERAKAELERDTIKDAAKQAQKQSEQLQQSYAAIRDEKETLKVDNKHLQSKLSDLVERQQIEQGRAEKEISRLGEQCEKLQSTITLDQSRFDNKQNNYDELLKTHHALELILMKTAPDEFENYKKENKKK